jgi:hypothetical protein
MSSSAQAIILSADYVGTEISAEYGHIPPCFLPAGQKRLFEHQVSQLRLWVAKITITLPQNFEIPEWDSQWFSQNDIAILRVPEGLSLGQSVKYALGESQASDSIVLLHGDTYFPNIEEPEADSGVVASAQGPYRWDRLANETNEDRVIGGLFSLVDGRLLLSFLEQTQEDFAQSINAYSRHREIKPFFVETWLDFGHLQNLYQARKHFSTTRFFNSVDYDFRTFSKSGQDFQKVSSEAKWFENLPQTLRIFTPPYLGQGEAGTYSLGYEPNPTLHDLFIFGDLTLGVWSKISSACFEFLEACLEQGNLSDLEIDPLLELTERKTLFRVEDWFESQNLDIQKSWTVNGIAMPSVSEILDETNNTIRTGPRLPGIMHGDFCFTNIFYDFRQSIVRAIDPRGGAIPGEPSVYGDVLYDLAKLNHSIFGYDQILAGRYKAQQTDTSEITFQLGTHQAKKKVITAFAEQSVGGFGLMHQSVRAITIHLFLGMIPLHSDRPERQVGFLARALGLFAEWYS